MVTSALVALLLLLAPEAASTGDPDRPPEAAARPSAAASTAPGVESAYDPTRDVNRAVSRLSSRHLLRVHGEFGSVQGHAATISRDGVGGLRAADGTGPAMLTWSRIDRVERRGHCGAPVAATLGVIAGLGGGVVIATVVSSEMPGDSPALAGVVYGTLVGVGAAGVGWLIGAMIPRWQVVYRKR